MRGVVTGYKTLSNNSCQRNPFSLMVSPLYRLALLRQSIKFLQYNLRNRVPSEFHFIIDSQDRCLFQVNEAEAQGGEG